MNSIKMFSYENLAIWFLGFAIISLMVERGLGQIYQTKLWIAGEKKLDGYLGGDHLDLKPWISIAVCVYLAFSMNLDLPAFLFKLPRPDPVRIVLTGLLLSGGSTSIMWMFRRIRTLRDATMGAKINELKNNKE